MTFANTDVNVSSMNRHLMTWYIGTSVPGATAAGRPTVLLDDGAHLAPLLRSPVGDVAAMVFVPEGHGSDDPRVVEYAGSPQEPGGEVAVGDDFYLQVQDYAAGAFMALLGPTIVTVTSGEDLEFFLADADRARSRGHFPEFLLAGAVRLANVTALGAGFGDDGPLLRLHVDAVGLVSTSSTGVRIGDLQTPLAELTGAWERHNSTSRPCAVCLGAVIDDAARCDALASRPWLAQYLTAVDALRTLEGNGVTGLSVSGFGARLLPALAEATGPDRAGGSAPVLLWSDDSGYLFDPSAGRVFSLSLAAAGYAEALLVSGSVEAASEVAERASVEQVAAFFARSGVTLAPGVPEPAEGGAR